MTDGDISTELKTYRFSRENHTPTLGQIEASQSQRWPMICVDVC